MRKKMHKKLNPKNKMWDRFYLVNYLEFGKTWEDFCREDGDRPEDDVPSAWDLVILASHWSIVLILASHWSRRGMRVRRESGETGVTSWGAPCVSSAPSPTMTPGNAGLSLVQTGHVT